MPTLHQFCTFMVHKSGNFSVIMVINGRNTLVYTTFDKYCAFFFQVLRLSSEECVPFWKVRESRRGLPVLGPPDRHRVKHWIVSDQFPGNVQVYECGYPVRFGEVCIAGWIAMKRRQPDGTVSTGMDGQAVRERGRIDGHVTGNSGKFPSNLINYTYFLNVIRILRPIAVGRCRKWNSIPRTAILICGFLTFLSPAFSAKEGECLLHSIFLCIALPRRRQDGGRFKVLII